MFNDFVMPIITVLVAGGFGTPEESNAFNYFFSLVMGLGFLMFIPVAIIKLLNRS